MKLEEKGHFLPNAGLPDYVGLGPLASKQWLTQPGQLHWIAEWGQIWQAGNNNKNGNSSRNLDVCYVNIFLNRRVKLKPEM